MELESTLKSKTEFAMNRLEQALEAIRLAKPGDRSEQDRFCQIVITDVEKATAVFQRYVLNGGK